MAQSPWLPRPPSPSSENGWCVHAQLTITQPTTGISFSSSSTQKIPVSSDNSNVSVNYSWQNDRVESFTRMEPKDGIKKFESWTTPTVRTIEVVADSGYSSDHGTKKQGRISSLSSNSRQSGVLSPTRLCKTTCSITLNPDSRLTKVESQVPVATMTMPPVVLQNVGTQTGPGHHQSGSRLRRQVQIRRHWNHESESLSGSIITPGKRQRSSKDSLRAKSSPPIRLLPQTTSTTSAPRTIHIDVYCTGSDLSSTGDGDLEGENLSSSSPHTVYESPEYRIRHHLKNSRQIPAHFNNTDETGTQGHKKLSKSLSTDKLQFLSHLIKSGVEQAGLFDSVKFRELPVPIPRKTSYSSLDSSDWCSTAGYASTIVGGNDSVDMSRNMTPTSFSALEPSRSRRKAEESNDSSIEVDLRESFSNSLAACQLGPAPNRQWWQDCPKIAQRGESTALGGPSIGKLCNVKVGVPVFKCKRQVFTTDADKVTTLRDAVIPPFLSTVITDSTSTEVAPEVGDKFGTFVKCFRKPGHHISGPPKNPACPCNHCRSYFQTSLQLAVDDNTKSMASVRKRAYSLESRSERSKIH